MDDANKSSMDEGPQEHQNTGLIESPAEPSSSEQPEDVGNDEYEQEEKPLIPP